MTFGEYAKRRELAGSRREAMQEFKAQVSPKASSAPFSTSTRTAASSTSSQRGGRSRRENGVHTTLPTLLTTFQSMTEQGQRPTRKAYLELLQAAAEYSNEREAVRSDNGKNAESEEMAGGDGDETGLGWKIAWSAWEDARLGGLELGIEAFDLLVKAAMPHPRLIPSLLYYAQANSYLYSQLSAETYDRLLRIPALQSNLETTLALMTEMRRAGHRPSADRMNQAAKMACEWDQAKVALDLCERLERESGQQAVEAQTWLEVLRCSARNQFVSRRVNSVRMCPQGLTDDLSSRRFLASSEAGNAHVPCWAPNSPQKKASCFSCSASSPDTAWTASALRFCRSWSLAA